MHRIYRWVTKGSLQRCWFFKFCLSCSSSGHCGHQTAFLYCRPITTGVANNAHLLAMCLGGGCLSGGAADGGHELYTAQQSAALGVWTGKRSL